jgi:hypothetical protein
MTIPTTLLYFGHIDSWNVHWLGDLKFLVLITVVSCFMAATPVNAKTYFVSLSGSDAAPGSITQPFLTIPKAYLITVAGDTIVVRGGTYAITTTINLSKSGTMSSRYYLMAYPGERPLLDCSSMAVSSSNRGIKLSGSFWYVKGIDIKKAGDNGMNVSGSNNIIEFCSFYENSDTGLQLGGGASDNQIINCDSYYNADPSQGNADGFSPKLDVGNGNYFYGCRSWQNSDDGWDGYVRPRPLKTNTTTLENCWSFNNGYLNDGSASSGNGNGFKMGGSDSANLEHNFILKRCLAFDNRVKGFDQNNNRGSMTLYNCTGYRNGSNYNISGPIDSGSTVTLINCVALGSYGALGSYTVQGTNSWLGPFSITSADFVSVDTTGVRGTRKADGSLPDITFMHLASASQLIDAGTNVGLTFLGKGPDLGAFEFDAPTSVSSHYRSTQTQSYDLRQNYPNPFNPTTKIEYNLTIGGRVTIKVFDVLGTTVRVLANSYQPSGHHILIFDGQNLASGMYFYRIQVGDFDQTRKMILLK